MGQSGNSSGAIARAAPIVRRHMLDRNSGGEAAGIFSDTKRTAGQRRSVFAPTLGTEGKAALTLALVFFLLFFFAGMVRVCRCVSSALREARSGDDGRPLPPKKEHLSVLQSPAGPQILCTLKLFRDARQIVRIHQQAQIRKSCTRGTAAPNVIITFRTGAVCGGMDAAAKKTIRRANAPQWKVAIGVGIGLALAAAPLAFKEVRAREQSVAQMRDSQYDKQGGKDDARDARLKRSKK